MSISETAKAWDLSPVLELVNALSLPNPAGQDTSSLDGPHITTFPNEDKVDGVANEQAIGGVGLGDFAKIWQFLGVSATVALHERSSRAVIRSDEHNIQHKNDYASDGAVRYGSKARQRKTVKWQDDTSADELAPGSASELDASLSAIVVLSKAQRKKKRKQERKAKEASNSGWTVSESEADNVFLQTPAKKASVHSASADSRDASRSRSMGEGQLLRHIAAPSTPVKEHKPSRTGPPARQASQPELHTVHKTPSSAQPKAKQHTALQWPVAAQHKSAVQKFLPSSVSPRPAAMSTPAGRTDMFPSGTSQAIQAFQQAQSEVQLQTPSKLFPSKASVIAPKIVRSGEDRHWALLLKLINEFSQDRKHLVAPMNMTTHNNNPTGIHLFVDASNIFIGFNDQLKRARNIPVTVKVPHVSLSFDALALLMERRRPIAKRTLVGSTPHLPAFDKAIAVGYECSILEKVYKARELTERQIYFRDRDSRAKGRSGPDGSADAGANGYSSGGGGYTSESGTAEKQYAPARMIEQGVDELLHMKMAQSLLDFDAPATMVVATGDAAQAEYSDGFKAMIERALRKGWTIELVSWSQNISSLYLRKDFRQKWGERFKVIYLDDYAEELLDM